MKPKKHNETLSLIIPAHNAEKVIGESLKEYLKFLSQFKEY